MRLSPADRELEHISRRSIRPIAGGLGLMFLSGVPAIVLMLPPGPATVISALAASAVGLFMAGLWIVLGRRQIPPESGHAAASGIVILVAAYLTLRGNLHPDDLIARLGGDEFVVLLPGSNDASDTMLARLDDTLANARDALPGRPLAVSVGRAVIEPDTDEDLPAALARADAAMYARRVRRLQLAV